jgi:hypothetical protein
VRKVGSAKQDRKRWTRKGAAVSIPILSGFSFIVFSSLSGCLVAFRPFPAAVAVEGTAVAAPAVYETAPAQVVEAAPAIEVIPGTPIYYAPNLRDVFFHDHYWYWVRGPYWYRATGWGDTWVHVPDPPHVFLNIPERHAVHYIVERHPSHVNYTAWNARFANVTLEHHVSFASSKKLFARPPARPPAIANPAPVHHPAVKTPPQEEPVRAGGPPPAQRGNAAPVRVTPRVVTPAPTPRAQYTTPKRPVVAPRPSSARPEPRATRTPPQTGNTRPASVPRQTPQRKP